MFSSEPEWVIPICQWYSPCNVVPRIWCVNIWKFIKLFWGHWTSEQDHGLKQRNFRKYPKFIAGDRIFDEVFIDSFIKLSGEKSMGGLIFLECLATFDFLG
jgi:hypothetical protein